MSTLVGNALIGQSGGTTCVINQSLVGIVQEAVGSDSIRNVYGTVHGVQGILDENLIDLGRESQETPEAVAKTPCAALRSVRKKITREECEKVLKVFQAHDVRYFFYIGGNDSAETAHILNEIAVAENYDIRLFHVPKTIDNDLSATDYTFGFQSAVDVATEALDRLHTTAESHERVMFLEVMGRDAGHIALSAGIAGGADVILIPEIPYDPERVAEKIRKRQALGRLFSIVIIAEGAVPLSGAELDHDERKRRLKKGGGAAAVAMAQLDGRVEAEMRCCVLGHLQRGGSPVPFDRVLATRFGVAAVDLIEAGRWGEMVRLKDGVVDGVPIQDATETYRLVDVDGELVRAARATGVEFGG